MEFYPHELKDFSKQNHRRGGSVYVVATRGLKYIKIGRSKCASLRLGSLQVGCPMDLHMVTSLKTPIAKDVEYFLHSKMKNCRVRGEWFSPSKEEYAQLLCFMEATKNHIDQFRDSAEETGYFK